LIYRKPAFAMSLPQESKFSLLYIRNLPADYTEGHFINLVKGFGEIVHQRLISHVYTSILLYLYFCIFFFFFCFIFWIFRNEKRMVYYLSQNVALFGFCGEEKRRTAWMFWTTRSWTTTSFMFLSPLLIWKKQILF
jgi:hypothetical protein